MELSNNKKEIIFLCGKTTSGMIRARETSKKY